ncbi:MAG: protein phosphatase 2C domain-containing protein [Synergistaceae bacterium]|nr:protein phosphatase 2C domain-containing protein [Synergistaceae bacterium]
MATKNSIFAIATDIGGRDENQDRAYALSLNGRTLLVLADGMGGHRGGAMASQAIIEAAERLFRANPAQNPEALLPQIVQEACGVIARENSARNLDGHSTCVLAFIDEKACLSWLRIGDSRLFIFADKNHWWRSIDHTMLDLRVLKGELTDDEARRHPDRPFVFRSVCATEPEMKVQHFGTLPAGAALFLCSDGVWDAFPAKELYNVTKKGNVELITAKIVKTAVARNGAHSDNCTALLYRAPFGNKRISSGLDIEDLHRLPTVTIEERKKQKLFLGGIIALFLLIVIISASVIIIDKVKQAEPEGQYEWLKDKTTNVEPMMTDENSADKKKNPLNKVQQFKQNASEEKAEIRHGKEGRSNSSNNAPSDVKVEKKRTR